MDEIITKEEFEESRRDEMREVLIDAFDGNSILFEIYKKRGWLDRLFTDRILSMDRDTLYISNQIAEILETEPHVVKNKRRVLLQYINPEEYGDGNAKTYKHNYISVFKMKMIHGLTGEGSEYTLPQLKELIYGNSLSKNTKTQDQDNEILIKLMRKMEKFEQFQSTVESGEFFEEIEKRISIATEKLMESNDDINELNLKISDLYDKVTSPNISIQEKESVVIEFSKLAEKHPSHAVTLNMYINAAQDRITAYKQVERELLIRNIKDIVLSHFNDFEAAKDDSEREIIRGKLQKLANENQDLSYDIRFWLSTAGKEKKKKGFWSFFNR
ncbi:hypothetical protein BK120_23130 [Paenibacillus sp. FSL A5-0031]|uniref:hypothetical protein n=1 Tax=Paenibacillus sp. FSL A5-0031 TaxID=1920420 RepID=UPI00096C45D1|nr:hypothetical protein [Paenibacillus sp. FSL A5-0031]OME78635.1 hypothetical protein BK120_23130 [Paenibacillus sp. FSL A5-0031]